MIKNLKIISRHGVGYDNIDTEASKRKNITLTITANSNAVAVAEHVMFMLLNISKRKEMYDSSVKSGRFDERNKLPKTIELWNKSILIADNEFAVKELSPEIKFDTIFIINCDSDVIEMDELNSKIVLLSIPLQFRDLYQRVSSILDQINSQDARKLNFNRFTYDPSMRTLSNDNLYLRFTEKESQIFNSLLDNSNIYISKKNLLKKVWSYNEDIDTHTL